MMKLAILGTDHDALQLAAAARQAGHEIVWVGDVRPADAEPLAKLAPDLSDRSSEWELLLDRAIADAVIVGRGTTASELRAEQLKRLAAEAVPLLVVHPACDSVLSYYEVDMTRRETGGIVRHYNPLAGHPAVAELAGWVRDGHPVVGPIHQVSCERQVADGRRETVLGQLARDAELLAAVAGDIRKVSASGPRTTDASLAPLQIQFTTANPASVRWSVAPGDGIELTLVHERGFFKFRARDDAPSSRALTWEYEDGGGERQLAPLSPFDAPSAAIQQLAAALAESDPKRRAAASTWDKATQSMEVVDAVELSLEKGRTIEVYQQQLTERLAFRGTMAAMGCGLLLVGFVAVVLVTLLGGAEGAERAPLLPSWPLILLAVLAFFLVMQAVPLLAQKSKKDRRNSSADAPGRSESI